MATTKTKTVQLGPRVSVEIAEVLEKHYHSRNAGAEICIGIIGNLADDTLVQQFRDPATGVEHIVRTLSMIYKRTMADLKGKFTPAELSLMIDVFNSTALMPQIAGQHMLINCVDGMELDGLDNKWKVGREAFTAKLQALTLIEAACLEIWANGFWYGVGAEDHCNIELYNESKKCGKTATWKHPRWPTGTFCDAHKTELEKFYPEDWTKTEGIAGDFDKYVEGLK